MSTFKEIASEMLRHGIPVIPIPPREKGTRLPNWPNLASTDPAQIEQWNEENPNYNCGAVAKSDGIWILDCDEPNLPERIMAETGKPLPSTLTVKSSKGFHFYFRQTDASRKMGNVKKGGLFDAQVLNKYVVCPGSTHPTGIVYQIVEDGEIVSAPEWLIEWVSQFANIKLNCMAESAIVAATENEVQADLKSKLKWMVQFLNSCEGASVYSRTPVPYGNGCKIYAQCPNSDEHTGDNGITQTAIIIMPGKGYDFVCQHAHCSSLDWNWYRARVETPLNLNDPRFPVEDLSLVEPTAAPESILPEPEEPAKEFFRCTDLGNAERLVARYGHNFKYCAETGKWYGWTGKRWRVDDTAKVYRAAKNTVRAILNEAAKVADDEERKEVLSWQTKSESRRALEAMISIASHEKPVATRISDFDCDTTLYNILSGTIDLRTGLIQPHDRDKLITNLSPVEYDKDAKCPLWKEFLRVVTQQRKNGVMLDNPAMVDFLQRAVGYTLTGATEAQCLFMLYGTGCNGKSTFLEVVRALMGDYSRVAEFNTFLSSRNESGGARNDLAKLKGGRFVTATESDEGKRLAESVVKALTGGDLITARFMYGELFEFQPQFKIWLGTNHKPDVRGTDEGIWRRIRLIPFTVRIPDDKKDGHLTEKLKAELPGILGWALEGLAQYHEHGLMEPGEVLESTDQYRSEQDVLEQFIESKCTLEPKSEVGARDLYIAYKGWAEDAKEWVLKERKFADEMKARGFQSLKRNNGKVYFGLSLRAGAFSRFHEQMPDDVY